MRRLLIVTAALVAAVLLYGVMTLPPRPVRVALGGVDLALARRTVAGVYHVHTERSDGAGSRADVAAAAARAGAAFAILTDHGDGTGPAEPPAYVDGVLCLDGVEISTDGGHYVALGMRPAPYPLGGSASAVVEDVRRLGGFGIVAHPDHPRDQLRWDDWRLPVDGVESINADSGWRNAGIRALSKVLFHYLLRPAPAIASVMARPDDTIQRWDEMNRTRLVVALAAVDAHGGAAPAGAEADEPRAVIGPGYEASFRTLTNRVVLDAPFSGDAAADAALLLGAIRAGRVYSVVDAFSPDVVVAMEGRVAVRSPLPDRAEELMIEQGGATRVEIRMGAEKADSRVPWVLTNWVGTPQVLRDPEVAPAGESAEALAAGEWRVEHSPGSSGAIETRDGGFSLTYQLRGGDRESQFVAAAADLQGGAFRGVFFEGIADRPMRVSVQLRYPPDDRRWISSVYLDGTTRTVFVPVSEMAPAERDGARPPEGPARSLLFVVDLVNTTPGASGGVTIEGVRVAR